MGSVTREVVKGDLVMGLAANPAQLPPGEASATRMHIQQCLQRMTVCWANNTGMIVSNHFVPPQCSVTHLIGWSSGNFQVMVDLRCDADDAVEDAEEAEAAAAATGCSTGRTNWTTRGMLPPAS